MTATGSTDEDGTGIATATFAGCTTSDGTIGCTVGDATFTYTINNGVGANPTAGATTHFVLTDATDSRIQCSFLITCVVTVTPPGTTATTDGGGTITDGDEPDFTLRATVDTDGTTACTGSLSGSATIDDTPAVDTGTTVGTTGATSTNNTTATAGTNTTGNELTITA